MISRNLHGRTLTAKPVVSGASAAEAMMVLSATKGVVSPQLGGLAADLAGLAGCSGS